MFKHYSMLKYIPKKFKQSLMKPKDSKMYSKLESLIRKEAELEKNSKWYDALAKSREYHNLLGYLKKLNVPHLSRLSSDGSPDHLLKRMIWNFCYDYVEKNAFNKNDFLTDYLDFEKLVYNDIVHYYYALTNWGVKKTLNVGALKLRKTNIAEVVKLFPPHILHYPIAIDDFFIIETTKDKSSQPYVDFEELIICLNLFKGIFGKQHVNTWKVPRFWPVESAAWGHPLVRRSPENYAKPRLENSEFEAFRKFYRFFKKITKPKQLKTAIERYNLGMQSHTFDDAILDFMIAVECLFSENKPELTHRISIRVALLLGKNESDTERIRKFISTAYSVRSKIVHGDNIHKNGLTTNEIKLELHKILNESIKAFLHLISSGKKINEIGQELDKSISSPSLRKKIQKLAKVL